MTCPSRGCPISSLQDLLYDCVTSIAFRPYRMLSCYRDPSSKMRLTLWWSSLIIFVVAFVSVVVCDENTFDTLLEEKINVKSAMGTYDPKIEARKSCVCVTFNMLQNMEARIKSLETALKGTVNCSGPADNLLGVVRGLIIDAISRKPLSNANITYKDCNMKTDNDGQFQITVPAGQQLKMLVKADNYIATSIFVDVIAGRTEDTAKTPLVPYGDQVAACVGTVRDATNKQPISAVNGVAIIREGVNNKSEQPFRQVPIIKGFFKYGGIPPGTYTIEAKYDTYTPAFAVASFTSGGAMRFTDALFANPKIAGDEIRIVLTWGSMPQDLDLHLLLPKNNELAKSASPQHDKSNVMWDNQGSKGEPNYAKLDVDTLDGHGPETITIYKGLPGMYNCYVHRFSEEGILRTSNANIKVFSEAGLIVELAIPTQGKDTDIYWEAFSMDGLTRKISIINRLRATEPTTMQ